MADERSLKDSTIQALGAKLDGFTEDLSSDEAAVLAGLIGLAGAALQGAHSDAPGSPEQANVSRPDPEKLPPFSELLEQTFRRERAPGQPIDPRNPLADSIGVGWLCVSWSKDYIVARTQSEIEIEGIDRPGQPEIPLRIQGLRPGPS